MVSDHPSFCTITPTRSDRPELLEFCKLQLGEMEVKPDKSYFIDYKPTSNEVDIIPRIKLGIELAKSDGFEYVFIIEDDDYYPPDYFKFIQHIESDLYGQPFTEYYNLQNNTHQVFNHPGRSSLFLTGFKISALDTFKWPRLNEPFLDIKLWSEMVLGQKKNVCWFASKSLGVKHGIGKAGGGGHRMTMKTLDKNRLYLKTRVTSKAFDFYNQLIKL